MYQISLILRAGEQSPVFSRYLLHQQETELLRLKLSQTWKEEHSPLIDLIEFRGVTTEGNAARVLIRPCDVILCEFAELGEEAAAHWGSESARLRQESRRKVR